MKINFQVWNNRYFYLEITAITIQYSLETARKIVPNNTQDIIRNAGYVYLHFLEYRKPFKAYQCLTRLTVSILS